MDFVILKVNGEDLRNATHEQAIQAFRQAKEPIIVEVTRRELTADNQTPAKEQTRGDLANSQALRSVKDRTALQVSTQSTGVQTDITAEEATLAAMAAAAFTTEDIRAALSLHHRDGVPSSETVYSSSVSGLLDIVELDAEEDEDELDDEEEDEVEDVDVDQDQEDEVDVQQDLHQITDRQFAEETGLLASTRSVKHSPSLFKHQHCVEPQTGLIDSGHFKHQTCACQESVNEQYDRNELPKLLHQKGLAHGSLLRNALTSGRHSRAAASWMLPLESIVFKEIKLTRKCPSEKFGLTLCYRNVDGRQDDCDVYVGEIEPDSVASRCGGVLVGDRIVKINGELIKSRSHVIDLFSASSDEATLLVARQNSVSMKCDNPNASSRVHVLLQHPYSSTGDSIDPTVENQINESVPKPCTEFSEFNRPDQDSGLGRTTDESARTEESSEQEAELEHKSRLNFNPGIWPHTQNSLAPGHQLPIELSQSFLTSALPLCDVFANYNPVDPIDQELVHLGRLMQSLAVHCRQLVQTKLNYHTTRSDTPTHTSGSEARAGIRREPQCSGSAGSVGDSVEQNGTVTTVSSSSSSSVNRNPLDSAPATPRVPRMGTRVELNTMSYSMASESPVSQSSRLLMTRGATERVVAGSVGNTHSENFVPESHEKKDTLTSDLSQSACYDQLSPETYREHPERRQTPSGQTSAYCTGESLRSHPENGDSISGCTPGGTGVSIRLWQPTQHTRPDTERDRARAECTNDSSEWTGPVAASLSDLGGSLLSLAATVPSVQNFFPTASESSRVLADSLSPASNWSIDGSSQSNQQRCPTKCGPVQRTVTGNGLRNLSADSGRDRLGRTSGAQTDGMGSGLDSVRTVSSTDSLPEKIPVPLGAEKKLPPTDQSHRSGHHRRRPVSNEPRGHNDPDINLVKSIEPGASSNEKLASKPTCESQRFSQSTGKCRSGNLQSRAHQAAGHSHSQSGKSSTTQASSQSVQAQSGLFNPAAKDPASKQCYCLPYLSPHRPHGHPNPNSKMIGHSSVPVGARGSNYFSTPTPPLPPTPPPPPLPPPPPTIPPPPPDQCIHPYEFYDHFCSTSWALEAPRLPFPGGQNRSRQTTHSPFPGQTGGHALQSEDRETSDIYETPYASVAVTEEPSNATGEMGKSRQPDSNSSGHLECNRLNENKSNGSDRRHDYTQMQPFDWFRNDPRLQRIANGGSHFAGPDNVAQYTSLLSSFNQFDLGYHYSQLPLYTSASHVHHSMPMQCSRGEEPTAATNVMEWVVKKRPDGSRYITRRPIRNRLLKERARRVAEERSGLTTDDDAASELKVGRYWNRTERRKQLEKARADRKKRQTAVVAPNNTRPNHPQQSTTNQQSPRTGQTLDLITMTTV